jgi:hypothetical protein
MLDGEDPFLSNCRSCQSPASGAVEDALDTTSIHSMSADMNTMVTSGMTSHDDSVADKFHTQVGHASTGL